ncbi:MAG: hypothetical protein HY432_01670 [Candidatus Liptonbacteria bacterium]|nr:hypothetical protein [Candidatus Liptonbacteria bacterium]
MTFFQPERKSLINYAIVALVTASLFASIWVILSYTRSVDLEHEISLTEAAIKKMQTDKSQLQDRTFSLLNDVNLKKFSEDRNLVEDKNPQYFKIGNKPDVGLAISHNR